VVKEQRPTIQLVVGRAVLTENRAFIPDRFAMLVAYGTRSFVTALARLLKDVLRDAAFGGSSG
jgi:hypothetical protein